MYKNQNDQQFDNSNKGINDEGSQNWEDPTTDVVYFNNPSTEEDKTLVKVGRYKERFPMRMEEYERRRLQAFPKNNDFFSSNKDDEREEENDLGINEDDQDEDDIDENEEEPRDFDDELLELGESPYPDR